MDDCTFVIFGATGNLAKIKLLPALYRLDVAGQLPAGLKVVGFGRRDWDDDSWREQVSGWLSGEADKGRLQAFSERLHFFTGDLGIEEDFLG